MRTKDFVKYYLLVKNIVSQNTLKISFYYYFEDREICITLIGINKLNDISFMFCDCDFLIKLTDISEFDTSLITNMSSLFKGCSFLISLPDISKWNTQKVKNMSCMFYGCDSLLS